MLEKLENIHPKLKISDMPLYARDRLYYKNIYNNLFWYKKHTGWRWIKGQNFGDYLSLVVVGEIAIRRGLRVNKGQGSKKRLFAAGSILHFACNDDVVWGAGINGKISIERHVFNKLDVRMVRGKLTAEFLREKGIDVPDIYGDPVLLLPKLFPDIKKCPRPRKVILLPNLNDLENFRFKTSGEIRFVSPFTYWRKILAEILTSELVLTSSLHGLIVSEAFKVPVRFIPPLGGETLFKYRDYLSGTGRDSESILPEYSGKITCESGIAMPELNFDTDHVIEKFPEDLFEKI